MRLIDVLRQAGWPESELGNALGVISLESGGNPTARNQNGEDSVGIFQINRVAHTQYSVAHLEDPLTNAQVAIGLFRSAGSYRDWWNAARALDLPPFGSAQHSIGEYASLADREMGGGGGGGGSGGTPNGSNAEVLALVGIAVAAWLWFN